MINKFLIIFSLLFLFQKNDIELKGIKKNYQLDSIINFDIKNNSLNVLHYDIVIEAKVDNEWTEIAYNIDNPKSKASIWYKINSNSSKHINLDLKKVKNYIPFKFKEYRFSVNYYSKNKGNRIKLESDIFLIK